MLILTTMDTMATDTLYHIIPDIILPDMVMVITIWARERRKPTPIRSMSMEDTTPIPGGTVKLTLDIPIGGNSLKL